MAASRANHSFLNPPLAKAFAGEQPGWDPQPQQSACANTEVFSMHSNFTQKTGNGKQIPPREPYAIERHFDDEPIRTVSGGRPVLPLRLFWSYARKDTHLREQLAMHLKLLQRRGLVASWHDGLVGPGHEWNQRISEHLEQADLILFLVSAYFMASDYIYNVEMPRALERHREGRARVIPVIVRDLVWSDAPFATIESLPKNGKAVTSWLDRHAAWRNVAEGIEAAVMETRNSRSWAVRT
jgi:hypothetical protein